MIGRTLSHYNILEKLGVANRTEATSVAAANGVLATR